jgi:hypothetical protein
MCGLAQSFTPQYSGTVLVIITANGGGSVANGFGAIGIRYGTGVAPANGVAFTGTPAGNGAISSSVANAGAVNGLICTAFVAGLTIGTPYWFDLGQESSSAGSTFKIVNVGVMILEL